MHEQFLPSQHLMLRKHAPLTRLDTDRIIHSTVIFLRHDQVHIIPQSVHPTAPRAAELRDSLRFEALFRTLDVSGRVSQPLLIVYLYLASRRLPIVDSLQTADSVCLLASGTWVSSRLGS